MMDFWGKKFEPIEMYRLINMLIERGDKHIRIMQLHGAPSVRFLNEDHTEEIGDAICHAGSYGHEDGLLEIKGLDVEDDVVGWLTAEEVLKHLDNYRKGVAENDD